MRIRPRGYYFCSPVALGEVGHGGMVGHTVLHFPLLILFSFPSLLLLIHVASPIARNAHY